VATGGGGQTQNGALESDDPLPSSGTPTEWEVVEAGSGDLVTAFVICASSP
jgi:hypothetical protein